LTCGVGLEVKRDAVRAGPSELGDVIGRALDHQVDVERCARIVDLVGDRGGDQRPDRDRRHEVAVHHVHVHDPGPGGQDLRDLRAEPGEVGGQDRGRHAPGGEQVCRGPGGGGLAGRRLHQTGCSIELWQCWQSRSSEELMRTIVWWAPQLGHWEASS
jgi:hypothetical protein